MTTKKVSTEGTDGDGKRLLSDDIVESNFESLTHKYNVVRKLFWKERCKRSSDRLIYQPQRLREICRRYDFDYIIDAIYITMKKKQTNYFNAFVIEIGQETSEGGWESYIGS